MAHSDLTSEPALTVPWGTLRKGDRVGIRVTALGAKQLEGTVTLVNLPWPGKDDLPMVNVRADGTTRHYVQYAPGEPPKRPDHGAVLCAPRPNEGPEDAVTRGYAPSAPPRAEPAGPTLLLPFGIVAVGDPVLVANEVTGGNERGRVRRVTTEDRGEGEYYVDVELTERSRTTLVFRASDGRNVNTPDYVLRPAPGYTYPQLPRTESPSEPAAPPDGKAALSADYVARQRARYSDAHALPVAGRRAVVVGSDEAENIGAHIARRLRRDIAFAVVTEPPVATLDVTDPFSATRYFEQFAAAYGGPPDTLILSHGVTHLDWFEDQPLARMREVVEVNLLGTLYAARAFVQETLASPGRKSLVLVGSMAHRQVLNGSAPYCAAKAGVAMLARCLAWELGPKGYDVYAVHPGNTEGTPMTEATVQGLMRYRGLSRAAAEAYWGAAPPARGEWLTPAQIADLVAYLVAGEHGGQLSGCQLELAGGAR